MKREIRITKKKGEDGHKIVSVRMREDTLKSWTNWPSRPTAPETS